MGVVLHHDSADGVGRTAQAGIGRRVDDAKRVLNDQRAGVRGEALLGSRRVYGQGVRRDVQVQGRQARCRDGVHRRAAGVELRGHPAVAARGAQGAKDLLHAVAGLEDQVPVPRLRARALRQGATQLGLC